MFKLTPTLLVLGAPPPSIPCVFALITELKSGSTWVYLADLDQEPKIAAAHRKVTAVNEFS
jgi:hypothetical protein